MHVVSIIHVALVMVIVIVGGTVSDNDNTVSNDVTEFEMNEIHLYDYITCSISL